ncbi:MAG TPA: FKBP-type peptidyl-prolyl cis-trans isomerase [Candidatus Saccharibacteria bacterium]|jgi:FKBP-type peptidyl-prolyl cis-trans isomerase|nr:FKBP-type peptidyl-prolyl cis-trans isomerase [Candidatus Saccharibacteria bacterium]HPW48116.1 FKBP-type peptidyl-prolyl cis-trans isomerase [Candidatus Saccharibacteria bacterium]
MRDKTQRIIIWIITLLFVISSFGAVVYYIFQNRQQEKWQAEYQKAIKQTQTNQNPSNNLTNPQKAEVPASKLTGTKMLNFEPVASVSSLQKIDTEEGEGAEVKIGQSVTVKYIGALARNGTIFDASSDHQGGTFTFKVGGGEVIKGWDQGVPGMKVGGKRRILIPASLGYGNQAVGTSIPANSDLVFDVEIVKINN